MMLEQLVIPTELIERLERIEILLLHSKETMTMTELAEYAKLSKSTLYKLTSRNEIPHYSPTGKNLYFNRKEIDIWLTTNKDSDQDQANLWANKVRRNKSSKSSSKK